MSLEPSRGRRARERSPEPWYVAAKAVVLPPLWLWFTWRFEGLERIPMQGPAIVACNHISYLDPLANSYAIVRRGRRPRFLAKEELFRIPVVGRALRGAGQIPVSRGVGGGSPLREAQLAVEAGEVVLIYPEGTVTKRPDFQPMEGKTGAVRLSLATGVPITPMASWGSQAVWQKSGKGSLRFGRPIWVKVGEPIDTAVRDATGDDERGSLRGMTQEVMVALTALAVDLRARYPARWS